nr:d3.1 [Tranosema rostrale ichnovirus]
MALAINLLWASIIISIVAGSPLIEAPPNALADAPEAAFVQSSLDCCSPKFQSLIKESLRLCEWELQEYLRVKSEQQTMMKVQQALLKSLPMHIFAQRPEYERELDFD